MSQNNKSIPAEEIPPPGEIQAILINFPSLNDSPCYFPTPPQPHRQYLGSQTIRGCKERPTRRKKIYQNICEYLCLLQETSPGPNYVPLASCWWGNSHLVGGWNSMSRHGRARGLSTREELDFNEHFCRSNGCKSAIFWLGSICKGIGY